MEININQRHFLQKIVCFMNNYRKYVSIKCPYRRIEISMIAK